MCLTEEGVREVEGVGTVSVGWEVEDFGGR